MVYTKFTPILHKVYIPTGGFSGEIRRMENCSVFTIFLHTLNKQRVVFSISVYLCLTFLPCVNHEAK
jgi:hypothetical protein